MKRNIINVTRIISQIEEIMPRDRPELISFATHNVKNHILRHYPVMKATPTMLDEVWARSKPGEYHRILINHHFNSYVMDIIGFARNWFKPGADLSKVSVEWCIEEHKKQLASVEVEGKFIKHGDEEVWTPEQEAEYKERERKAKLKEELEMKELLNHDHPESALELKDGYKWVRLQNSNELKLEGKRMSHCVGSYTSSVYRKEIAIYSLRDKHNKPHLTIEVNDKHIIQARGKLNKDVNQTSYKEQYKAFEKAFKKGEIKQDLVETKETSQTRVRGVGGAQAAWERRREIQETSKGLLEKELQQEERNWATLRKLVHSVKGASNCEDEYLIEILTRYKALDKLVRIDYGISKYLGYLYIEKKKKALPISEIFKNIKYGTKVGRGQMGIVWYYWKGLDKKMRKIEMIDKALPELTQRDRDIYKIFCHMTAKRALSNGIIMNDECYFDDNGDIIKKARLGQLWHWRKERKPKETYPYTLNFEEMIRYHWYYAMKDSTKKKYAKIMDILLKLKGEEKLA